MKAFNPGTCGGVFADLTEFAQMACAQTQTATVQASWTDLIDRKLVIAGVFAIGLDLPESRASVERMRNRIKGLMTNADVYHGLTNIISLMRSEMGKRQALMIEPDKTKFYVDEARGSQRPIFPPNALQFSGGPSPALFGDKVDAAFPSAYMDIVEAGRCLALGRNNAAVYHLCNAAEFGLRALAWDRRVRVKQHKREIPLDFAQWGELIHQIEGKVNAIKKWRSKAIAAEAEQFYNGALVELRSFNDGYRKHIAHARAKPYEDDQALALFGNVRRFMQRLAEKVSEATRTPTVWTKPPKVPDSREQLS